MTINEFLASKEEAEVGKLMHQFEGGDAGIVAEVRHQMAVEHGNIVEINSEDEEDIQPMTPISCSEIIQLCEKLEMACLTQIDVDTLLELTRQLRRFRGVMRHKELQNMKQTTLNSYWQK